MRLALACWLLSLSLLAQNRAPAIDSIRRDELRADLFFLASDGMRGRLTNTPEYDLAAEWIASRFARLGLQKLEGETYFQRFELVTAKLGETNRLLLGTPDARRTAKLGEEYYPLNFSVSGEVKGRVVLAGYGVQAPEYDWDDYKGRDVKGSIVMVFDGDPDATNPKSAFDGLVTSEYANARKKALFAQERGAAAVLVVSAAARGGGRNGGFAANYWPKTTPRIDRFQLATDTEKIHIPVLQITSSVAEQILGTPLDLLHKQANSAGGQVFVASAVPVELATSVSRTTIADRNLVAKVEGSDPALKDEAVIVSAHYDHDGADGVRVFNGADDNGSGTVAVLEIAQAYVTAARAGQRPKRTVIFAIWGSEERGLLGSWAWVANPLWPLEKTVASLNMDMIGRNEEVPEGGGPRFTGLKPQTSASNANSVNIMGYSFNPELIDMVKTANRETDLTLKMEYDNNRSNLVRRSDQWPFLQHHVPSVFFHTGLHPDYHTTGDRPERIEYPKMERIVKLVYQASWDVANTAKRPKMPAKREIPAP
jgi:Peptidase family M28/PA domain